MAGMKYWLWLRNLHGISNQICLILLRHFGTPEHIYYADAEEYAQVEGLTKRHLEGLKDKSLGRAEEIQADCTALGIDIHTMADADYPDRLRAIPDAPCVLYSKGIWPDFDSEAAVAVIGSRRSTPYGIRIGETLGYGLAKGGAYVVSGLAAGGDAAGHRGALLAGKHTAAVLGGGIDVIYPRENRAMYADIAANGVLLSEYPPHTRPEGSHFLERNRIISGLSAAVIVVEAPLRSGTANTVQHALEQGREIYAVPGPVDAVYSQGCNRLIREGAGAVTRAEDVLMDLQLQFPDRILLETVPIPPSVGHSAAVKAAEQTEPAEPAGAEKEIDNAEELEYIVIKTAAERFTDDQIQILLTLSDRPMIVDDIAETTQIPVRRVLSALTVLEIDDLVKQESGNRYTLHAVIQQ